MAMLSNYKNRTYMAGECFHQAALNLIPDDWLDCDDGYWFVPSITNMAFACELYLKSLLSSGDNSIHGHDLYDLFSKLPTEKKDSIINSDKFRGDESFMESLEFNRSLFNDWRYHFETGKKAHVDIVFLERFAKVLHYVAKSDVR